MRFYICLLEKQGKSCTSQCRSIMFISFQKFYSFLSTFQDHRADNQTDFASWSFFREQYLTKKDRMHVYTSGIIIHTFRGTEVFFPSYYWLSIQSFDFGKLLHRNIYGFIDCLFQKCVVKSSTVRVYTITHDIMFLRKLTKLSRLSSQLIWHTQ